MIGRITEEGMIGCTAQESMAVQGVLHDTAERPSPIAVVVDLPPPPSPSCPLQLNQSPACAARAGHPRVR